MAVLPPKRRAKAEKSVREARVERAGEAPPQTKARTLAEIDGSAPEPIPVDLLDPVLGAGLVPGSSVLVLGPPGIGASTLLLQVADAVASAGKTVLYATTEETAGDVAARAARIGVRHPDRIRVLAGEADVEAIVEETGGADALVVDSLLAVFLDDVAGNGGTEAQVRAASIYLTSFAKHEGKIVLIRHYPAIACEDNVAECLVDAVVEISNQDKDGDFSEKCYLYATKNRRGAIGQRVRMSLTGRGFVRA